MVFSKCMYMYLNVYIVTWACPENYDGMFIYVHARIHRRTSRSRPQHGLCACTCTQLVFFVVVVVAVVLCAHHLTRDERSERERVRNMGVRMIQQNNTCSLSYSSCLLFLCHRRKQSVSGTPE